MPQPDPPINIAAHLDWLRQTLAECRFGEFGVIFTKRDGVVIRCQRVFRETFKSQAEQEPVVGRGYEEQG